MSAPKSTGLSTEAATKLATRKAGEQRVRQLITQHPAAKRALDKLLGAALSAPAEFRITEPMVIDLLHDVESFRPADPPGNKTKHWATLAGMSLPTLTRFPSKLRVMAKQIERLNEHPFFVDEMLGYNSDENDFIRFRLPYFLRLYASLVNTLPSSIGRRRRNQRSERHFGVVGLTSIIRLLRLINRAVGRSCYPEVADLLSAVTPEDWTEGRLEKLYRAFMKKLGPNPDSQGSKPS